MEHQSLEPVLQVSNESGPVLVFRFGQRERLSIGRSDQCDVPLADASISRHQCDIERDGAEGFRVADRSGRGTVVNGESCTQTELGPGKVIRAGRFFLEMLDRPTALSEAGTMTGAKCTDPDGAKQAPNALVLVLHHEGMAFRFVPQKVTTIGRSEDCHLQVRDSLVSSFHCRLVEHDGLWHIEDLGSSNGTFVNNVRVKKAVLEPGSALRIAQTQIDIESLNATRKTPKFHGIVSDDPTMLRVFSEIEKFAQHSHPVLITGESGTGKELVANAIHSCSMRAKGKLVRTNSAAIPEHLAESHLFGHVKGAFTGAVTSHKGYFEQADGGTLFLDEIGEINRPLQAKLLRVLESREIVPVGGTSPRSIDFRLISATNQDLAKAIESGAFRNDLFHRLSVFSINLPPLRERSDDILLLAEYFIAENAAFPNTVLSEEAKKFLVQHDWSSGNVRELRSKILSATVMCGSGGMILPEHLGLKNQQVDLKSMLDDFERKQIANALKSSRGSVRKASQYLNLPRESLRRRIEKYSLQGLIDEIRKEHQDS